MSPGYRQRQKWLTLASVLGLLLGSGTALSYLKSARNEIVRTATERTPATFDLERLKLLADDLVPHLTRHEQSVARLKLLILGHEKQVREAESKLATARDEMDVLRRGLNVSEMLVLGEESYTHREVERELARRLDSYERDAATLNERKTLLSELRKLHDKSLSQIDELVNRRESLLAQQETLKARLLAADLETTGGPSHAMTLSFKAAEDLAADVEVKLATRLALAPVGRSQISIDTRPSPQVRYDTLFNKEP